MTRKAHLHLSQDAIYPFDARGYAKNGVNENPLFDANFVVEVG